MSIGRAFVYPEEQQRLRAKAGRLSWLSIALLLTASMALYFTLGQSQAMKTAWVSDILTAVPPAALLVAMRYELRPYTERFPFGFTRSVAIAFLVTASILSVIGMYLLYDSLMKLVRQERPPIGTMVLFGHQLWAGWLMIAALAFSLACGLLLGLLKKPVAKGMNDKALNAEATMNRDEWLSEGAAIVGIVLVGFGYWWGDAAAASFISLQMVRDGWMNMRLVVGDLMDESPTKMGESELEDIASKVRDRIGRIGWISAAGVRLREHGRAITGEVFVVPGDDAGVVAGVEQVAREVREVDWRLHDIVVMPVARLEETKPPQSGF